MKRPSRRCAEIAQAYATSAKKKNYPATASRRNNSPAQIRRRAIPKPTRRCAVKVCVACKRAPVRGHVDDAYHCREILGHVAPNWDAPGAEAFFTEDAKPEECSRAIGGFVAEC